MVFFSFKSHDFFFFIIVIITIFLSSNIVASQHKPRAFHIPIKKYPKTPNFYYASIQLGTPPTTADAAIDLGGRFLSLACDQRVSSTRRPIPCGSVGCKTLENPGPQACENRTKTCAVSPFNPFGGKNSAALSGHLNDDVVPAYLTDCTVVYPTTYSTCFAFVCADDLESLLSGLANGFSGILGLRRTAMSQPSKLAAAYYLPPKFAVCVSSSNERGFGDLFIGGGPYLFSGGNDAFRWLTFTPFLQLNSVEYFIGVKSIRIDKRIVRNLDATSLSGGTKISTSTPCGIRSSAYAAVVGDFSRRAAARNISRAAPVAPFGACFDTGNVRLTKAGPRVPAIDIELEGNVASVDWRIHGANSMVRVSKNVIVDGGAKARESIVLGGLQIEDNFLEFDLTTSRLGFSSSLLARVASCSNFRNL